MQVCLLADRPAEPVVEAAMELVPHEGLVAFVDREWYWLPVDGVSNARLPVSTIEQLVGPMTMRTLGTAERLLAKFA